ncbi:MAG TPA: hypothetical protein VL523_09055 [Terriglobia bacterium]|nr:hypothetical protein [Terriglobia bacterium]
MMSEVDASKPDGARARRCGGGVNGLTRALVRAWLTLCRRRVRLIGGGRLPAAAAILRACHPAAFADALCLVAACERPLVCVVDGARLSGGQSLLASGLGMILYQTDASAWHLALRACTEVLGSGGWVVVFEDAGTAGRGAGSGLAGFTLAREAWASAYPDQLPVVVPWQRFRPKARGQEVLIHVGQPLSLDASNDAPLDFSAQQLDAAFRDVCGENVFGLDSADLNRLLAGLEQALRDKLQNEWAVKSHRRQKVDGFRLSPGAAETIRSINRTEPEALVALLELAEADRETRRQGSLVKLRADFERRTLTGVGRFLGWAESILGLPVALYGALNHFAVALVLLAAGLLRRREAPTSAVWVARVLVVLGCYAAQIALVDRILGRAGAGYYATTLPVSGAYLFRYAWLLQRRTRILLLGLRANRLQALADERRRRFYERLEWTLSAGPHSPQQVSAP